MSDSFVDLLETSLEVPDFELGEAQRAALLAAAMGPVAIPENVVPFPCVDDNEQAAFDWLMGERPADVALMDRLMTHPGFYAAVVAQHGFLRELRSALRLTAAPGLERGAKTPRRTARAVGLMIGAMAASLTAMVALQALPSRKTGSTTTASVAGDGGGTAVTEISLLPSGEGGSAHVANVSLPFAIEPGPASAGVVPLVAKAEAPAAIELPEGVEPIREWKDAGVIAAREAFGGEAPSFGEVAVTDATVAEEPVLAFAARGKSSDGGGHDGLYAMVSDSTASRGNNWYYWAGGQDGSLSVPEPGGCFPVMIGCLLLWWRKRPTLRS